MPLSTEFVASLTCPTFSEIVDELKREGRQPQVRFGGLWNEVAPSDLYCYLYARFGRPNGLQNWLRSDSSDNLIHWEWMLQASPGWVLFQGMNFRTAITFLDVPGAGKEEMPELAAQIKADFVNQTKSMGKVRQSLEHWTEFINPYQRIRSSVHSLLAELDALGLSAEDEPVPDIQGLRSMPSGYLSEMAAKYSKGLGLCFGIRSMLPVMAESFVNLLLFALMRPELKSDKRLRENTIRQPIDVRIKSLSITCGGFESPVDYTHVAFKDYQSLVNERNDLLHGNVVLEKLKFNEVYFSGRVPIFKRYRSLWERTLGVDIQAVGLHRLSKEVEVVERMVGQLKAHLDPATRDLIEQVSDQRDLGLDEKRGKFGILFSRELVDMFPPDDD